ncbi:DUF5343 domain-containing protein [Candidatus Entotheonella palauensis]|uniref:DUF5343 domain-containing protein n=1 Tax=Candidatus Entotheonella palauensis TaxID=93172 RepID=UPI000B7D4920|nr:DUF5343 domain-containing protein [Candidatus Entotheonella palauensis]
MANLPYVQAISTLETMLEKIKTASVPEKFSQDFVSTKLMLKGGNGRAVIPFIKKMGLVSSDGTPTNRYKEFRNPNKSEFAIADAMRELYEPLFEMNEYVYELDGNKLKGLIVEATGAEANSTVVQRTLSTFQALRKIAKFESNDLEEVIEPSPEDQSLPLPPSTQIRHHNQTINSPSNETINLSYTINLNLPATTDIEVFNAIFKSLK